MMTEKEEQLGLELWWRMLHIARFPAEIGWNEHHDELKADYARVASAIYNIAIKDALAALESYEDPIPRCIIRDLLSPE